MTEFLKRGHDAYSCDLQEASGNYPERHMKMDCFRAIKLIKPDFLGMHPECTRLTVSANKWYKPRYSHRFPKIHREREEAICHFLKCVNALKKIGKGYIENPIGIMNTRYKKPSQIIQPWMFGHVEQKATCLWLEGLELLEETNNVYAQMMRLPKRIRERLHYLPPGEYRSKIRSKTFSGIARAMASQWK